jgi:uncharacterized membrane protein
VDVASPLRFLADARHAENPKSLSRKSLILLIAMVTLLSLAPLGLSLSSRSLTLRVYSDGYVDVAQTLTVSHNATSIQVQLLSPMVSDLVATDQNGSPLSYGFSSGESNVTVYTLGATQVNLHYETDGLTSKNGSVWTLAFRSSYNSTVILPQFSTLGSVSGTPYSINQTDMYPEMTLSAGPWDISYGVPLGRTSTSTTSASSTSTGSTTSAGGPSGLASQQGWELGAAAAVIIAAGVSYRWWRRRRLGPVSKDLRPDDLQVLNFIQEKGGKVLEPEIRMKFALPKTSAWRQIKRLERLGYVKVTKIGSQNQIELLKDRRVEG